MKDFPMFTTENGAASLVLREIPHRGDAYITLQASQQPQKLLQECVSFCLACGAVNIFAKGEGVAQTYPLHTRIYEMRGRAVVDGASLDSLFPVTEQTVSRWREIYNHAMQRVDNAGTLTYLDEERILKSGGAYFVHNSGDLLGIGWMEEEKLLAIAAVRQGMGRRVMNTLLSLVEGASVTLEVASTNVPAVRLYEKMGFIATRELGSWYRIR